MECVLCGSCCLESLKAPRFRKMVIGDRRVAEGYFGKVICKDCGCIQTLQDENYKKEIGQIFQNYESVSVPTFRSKGELRYNSRLQAICQKINTALELSEKGNVLDIGCGSGEWLTYFNQIKPEWDLYGMDVGEHFRNSVLSRSQVRAFFTNMDEIKKRNIKFDLVVINYTLCVCKNAIHILNVIHEIIDPDGILFIIDTNFMVHPYQFNIIEHAIHFNRNTLLVILEKTKWKVLDVKFQGEEKDVWAFAKRVRVWGGGDTRIYMCIKTCMNIIKMPMLSALHI